MLKNNNEVYGTITLQVSVDEDTMEKAYDRLNDLTEIMDVHLLDSEGNDPHVQLHDYEIEWERVFNEDE